MPATTPPKSNTTALLLIGVLFAIFGFITWLNGTLIQFLKTACELNESQASLVTFAFFISYTVMALPSSALLRITGLKNGMGVGLLILAVGCLIFIPAANSRSYILFLVGLFTQGLGLTIMQTAVNPYVSIVGPIESAAKRISIMGICNKLSGAFGSLVLGSILLNNLTGIKESALKLGAGPEKEALLDTLSHKIVLPYSLMAGALFLVAILIRLSSLPDIKEEATAEQDALQPRAQRPFGAHTYMFLGALAIFAYVGVEVLAGDYIGQLGDYLKVDDVYRKWLTSITLFFMLGGYLLGIVLIPKIISQEKALVFNALGGLVFTTLVLFTKGETAVFCLAFNGFFQAVMWPAIFPLGIRDLGKYTKTGSALLIMGISGGAVIPWIRGQIADSTGNGQMAFWVMIPCYLYILFFALKGHKIGHVPPQKRAEPFDPRPEGVV